MLGLIRSTNNSGCVICGKSKPSRFWFCKPCSVQWGVYRKPYKSWPSWIRFLINDKMKENYRNRNAVEISVDPDIIEYLVGEDFVSRDGYFTRI